MGRKRHTTSDTSMSSRFKMKNVLKASIRGNSTELDGRSYTKNTLPASHCQLTIEDITARWLTIAQEGGAETRTKTNFRCLTYRSKRLPPSDHKYNYVRNDY